MKIRCPAEVTILWLNDWQYYADLDWASATLIQLEVGWETGGAEAIVRLLGFGIRAKIVAAGDDLPPTRR